MSYFLIKRLNQGKMELFGIGGTTLKRLGSTFFNRTVTTPFLEIVTLATSADLSLLRKFSGLDQKSIKERNVD